ncbi:hypothetical protein OHA40_00675 [Nocardia sp. NBC_00508]|uniref:hypothetical protein n=1 Tax=Nocardia sp. NBC_00508 TaxID=2975992 RepID=UPI002E81E823|nr:hypothetical protein [Nocardia sp. NBC_00508]WUD66723.1 hypothetical protein OHA40_00675 [Nocardia sp. NBC_00508]
MGENVREIVAVRGFWNDFLCNDFRNAGRFDSPCSHFDDRSRLHSVPSRSTSKEMENTGSRHEYRPIPGRSANASILAGRGRQRACLDPTALGDSTAAQREHAMRGFREHKAADPDVHNDTGVRL